MKTVFRQTYVPHLSMPSLTHTGCQVCKDTPFYPQALPIHSAGFHCFASIIPTYIMHTPSIMHNSYRVYLNMYMEDRLYLA